MVIRPNRTLSIGAVLLLAAVGAAPPAYCQSGIATGALNGSVADGQESRIAGALVVATNVATGFSSSQKTDGVGSFRIRLLPPGSYTVRAEREGFAPAEQRDVLVRVGDVLTIRFVLEVATVVEELVVTEGTPLIETARTSATSTVDSHEVDQFPLNGRDFVDLVRLAPQVTFRLERPVVAGNEGLMNSFNVDGADANSAFFGEQLGGGSPPFTYSQSAIQEFQVLRSSYNVRFGGASGGIINGVTKTGTNKLRGGALAFLQTDSMVATDAFGTEQPDLQRLQFGASLGGPIRQDTLHFFVAYDSQRRDMNTIHGPIGLAPELRPAFDARLLSLGLDPAAEYDFVETSDADVLLVRLDWAAAGGQRLWFRSNWLDYEGENSTLAFLSAGRSNLGTAESSFVSSLVGLDSVFGARSFNQALIQYVPAKRPRSPNFTDLPQIQIGFGFDAVLGQSWILPTDIDEGRIQLRNDFTLQLADHALQVGLDYSVLDFDNEFLFQGGGHYIVPTYEQFLSDQPCAAFCIYIQAFSPVAGQLDYESELLSLYVGDEWRASPRLTLEFGVRLEHQDHPPAQNPNPLEPRTSRIPDDTNLGPRLGFAWDVKGDGGSVLRGGAGVFHSFTPALVAATAISQNGINASSLFLFPWEPFFPAFPERLPPEVGQLGLKPPDIMLMAPNFRNPETRRLSLGYDRQMGTSWRVGAEVVVAESRRRSRQFDVNLDPTPLAFTSDGRPIYGFPFFPFFIEPARLDPRFGVKNQFTSDAEAEYHSVVLSVARRFGGDWSFRANYTYAEWKDHDTAETDLFNFVPEDHYNLDQDWAWATYDIRHRLAFAGSYAAPLGFTVSATGTYESNRPFNAYHEFDLNGDNFFFDRPGPDPALGLDEHLARNSFRVASFTQLDLRVAKSFRAGERHEIELLVDVFNATNEVNYLTHDENFTRFGQINPDFGKPLTALPPRTWQVGLRYRF